MDPATPDKTPHLVANADGRPVLVVQTGKAGRNIGQIRIDLDRLKSSTPADFEYTLIPVTDRFPDRQLDPKIKEFLAPFTRQLDSIAGDVVGTAARDFDNGTSTGVFPNWIADFGAWYGRLKLDSLRKSDPAVPQLDFAIMNAGGIRNSIPKGPVTKGQIMDSFPFSNKFVVMEISGRDLLDMFRIAARQGAARQLGSDGGGRRQPRSEDGSRAA